MNLNTAIIIGYLARDPEMRFLNDSTPVANFAVATNRVWTDSKGERQQETEFHHIVVFGRQAETATDYLRKGQLCYVEGRLRTRSWMSGDKRFYRTEIIAERIQFGPKRQGEGVADDDGSAIPTDMSTEPIGEDEVPF